MLRPRTSLNRVKIWLTVRAALNRGDRVRHLVQEAFRALVRQFRRRAVKSAEERLTAVEYEAVTLIAYEGREAYARACEQADYCRRRASEDGYSFWSRVADEVALRTKGRVPERRR